MTDSSPFLTDAEVSDLCRPLTQPAAQVRYLRGLGFQVERKRDGRPLAWRKPAAEPDAQPDWASMEKVIRSRA